MRFALVPGLVLTLVATTVVAQERPYGDTYTEAELEALDRALHAANLNRSDLTFDKALTKGHGCLPVVRELLHDPLAIAPTMDGIVEQQAAGTALGLSSAVAALVSGAELLEPGWSTGVPTLSVEATSPEELVEALRAMLARQPTYDDRFDEDLDVGLVLDALRARLPNEMIWHEVVPSPFSGERETAAQEWRKDDPAATHEAAAALGESRSTEDWLAAFGDPERWLRSLPDSAFPTDAPLIVETPHGRIGLGTPGDDTWTGDFAALIDPGGDDRYVDCELGAATGVDGRRVGFFADLAGDDVHDARETDLTMGAAILGVAAFYDLGAGNDRYLGGHVTMGAAIGGVAVFHDDGGTDLYEGRTFTQGAAGFGIAVFHDDSVQELPEMSGDEGTAEPVDIHLFDNDRLSAWGNAQAFARPRSVAFCINRRGNDTYEAGGVYLHAPLFADRYQSFSQGFAIGSRGIDWAGGIAMVIDHDGNDRYLGDIYNQGVGYWYGAGFVWDGGGNDLYEMTQYGQGSGIHLAIGGLIDVAGNDTYVMHSGLGQGGSHDYAASVLHDRDGNDRYHGSTSCNGCGLTNSVGLQIDRAGNDTYGARSKSGLNFGRPARGFPSIGVLLDLAGTDDYLGVMSDGGIWRHTDIGVGLDVAPPEDDATEPKPEPDVDPAAIEIPEVCSYEGPLTQEVFDELWAISVRWEVGENRTIVPKARERLVAFGADILPMLDAVVETDQSGLELRAFVDVLRGLTEAEAADDVMAFLRSNGTADSPRRRRIALHVIGELKLTVLEDVLLTNLTGDDGDLARRAASALSKLESHAGNDTLIAWLGGDDARARATAISTLLALGADAYTELRPLLDSSDFTVRGRLVTGLAKHVETYGEAVVADLADTSNPVRHTRSLLDILARSAKTSVAGAMSPVGHLLAHTDAGIRADACRVVRAWEAAGHDVSPVAAKVAELAESDPDPLVRALAR